MTLFAAIPVMLILGWSVPRWVVGRLGTRLSVVWGALAAIGLGAALVFAGAFAAAAIGLGDAKTELESALNAWKILLLLAPAAALDARRRQIRENGES